MDLVEYLKRINYQGGLSPDIQNLKALHRAHVSHVPFENLDIHYGRKIVLDEKRFYHKVVREKRGGFCYELNGLFASALQMLGYQVYRVAARVYLPEEESYGPDFAHISLLLSLEDQSYLLDVGFGSSFPEPLLIQRDKVQEQDTVQYVLEQGEEEYITVQRSYDQGQSFVPMYQFRMQPYQLQDFTQGCHFHQNSEESPLYRKKLCSIATAAGRITLTSNHLTITEVEKRTKIVIKDEADFRDKLIEYFGIRIPFAQTQ